MAKYNLKKPSKRQSAKKKYKIAKKVTEHNRKMKRDSKKKGLRKPAEKMIDIPNSCPFKEEMQIEAEVRREQIKTEKQQKKIDMKKAKTDPTRKRKLNTDVAIEIGKKALLDPESVPTIHHNQYVIEPKEIVGDKTDKSTRVFANEVRKTIEAADIVIEVLDARDPLGSRNRTIERLVISSGKRLILLLNKIDLVPKSNVVAWLKYLRQELPTIAFKASVQEQSTNLGRFSKAKLLTEAETSKCVGAELVMSLLSNYCRNKNIKTSVRVGIVGYPNVGKSSVINSLKRRRSCQTGAVPGVTRQSQEVHLDKHIVLIDSPGVILATKEQFDPIEAALKNAIKVEALTDPISPITAILRRCSIETLMMHYNIPRFETPEQFLALVANKMGRLRKGGRPDIKAVAKTVLQAWNSGKLKYHTQPPEKQDLDADHLVCSTALLTEFSQEFNLDAVEDMMSSFFNEFDHIKIDL